MGIDRVIRVLSRWVCGDRAVRNSAHLVKSYGFTPASPSRDATEMTAVTNALRKNPDYRDKQSNNCADEHFPFEKAD